MISSNKSSGEAKDGISGALEYSRRYALLWKVTAVGGGTEVADVEVSQVVRGIVWEEGLSRVAAAEAGSGKVAEPCKFSVVV